MESKKMTVAFAQKLIRARLRCKVVFDGFNPHFKNKYATLGNIVDKAEEALAAEGLGYYQTPGGTKEEAAIETTIIDLETGETFSGTVTIPLEKISAIGVGSALSYARRYCLAIVVGIVAEEDDDGAADMSSRDRKPAAKPVARRDESRGDYKDDFKDDIPGAPERSAPPPRREPPKGQGDQSWKIDISKIVVDFGFLSVLEALKVAEPPLTIGDAPALKKVLFAIDRIHDPQERDRAAASLAGAIGDGERGEYFRTFAESVRGGAA